MRRRTFLTVSGESISASEAIAGDICLYDKITGKPLIAEASKFRVSWFPSNKYSPVGVVVIPGSHNVYGDGSCGVMSLKEMNYSTPDIGSTEYQAMFWGDESYDTNIINYNRVCYVGSKGNVSQTLKGVSINAYLPSNKFSTLQNPYDKDTWYHFNSSNLYVPSPYNEDDTRNSVYYQTSSPSSTANCLSDFDGNGNTTKLIRLATGQSGWKTASSITNSYDSGYYPPACCCWRYHTEGTNQGDWYLPACGELGYIMPKFNEINQTISTLITAYGSTVGVKMGVGQSYWSSTEDDVEQARRVDTGTGYVYPYSKGYYASVRAYICVK